MTLNDPTLPAKARMFKSRGLSHRAIAERLGELYGVYPSVHTVKSWCLLRRRTA